jgi:starch synthase (maltosyl-transferring)
MSKPSEGRQRVAIENVEPELGGGRFPIKRIAGDAVTVEADVFADGHDQVRALLLWKREGEPEWRTSEMRALGNDRWRGEFPALRPGLYLYTVAGEIDRWSTWRGDLRKRIAAQQEMALPLESGALLLEEIAGRARPEDRAVLTGWAGTLRDLSGVNAASGATARSAGAKSGTKAGAGRRAKAETKTAAATEAKTGARSFAALDLEALDRIQDVVNRYPDPRLQSRYRHELAVVVDRERAQFSAWYELFPRSWAAEPGKHGTLRDVAARLDYVARMGFDVLYLPPIHPIGRSFRKGKNNSTEAAPGDEGSPWAIGAAEGGHTAIHPSLGSLADFKELERRARAAGLEIALDIAFQCSPDHPWVTQHPEFFKKRPDGSIQYAENPPKKYQDIYPLDFESSNWRGLWDELKNVFEFWMEQGVRIFRVDNPHTKAFPFWEWAIGELKAKDPELIFLAEAFTRPRVMEQLAKLGFNQSYTYFAWRNSKEELTDYLRELTGTRMREYFRPNFWPNTPDILTEALQHGGLPAFKSRLVLAGTLAANYGIYGPAFELGVNLPASPGSEEYLNSEKYEIKSWDLNDPASLSPLLAKLNHARRSNPALQSNERLRFHPTDNPSLLCYSKRTADGANAILAVVSLDPFHVQSGWVSLDLAELGLGAAEAFRVQDLLAGPTYPWRGARNYVELRPWEIPAHLFRVIRGGEPAEGDGSAS